ncbi:hypothetical protein ACFWY6_16125 [Streptomyces sp. NPDC059037]|uniref:hypothetical protein n=1 Tax=Streptomyces sp. NPDC059037 TaxID=3346710 RepID=UPI0036A22F8E
MFYLWLASVVVILLMPALPWITFPGHRRIGIIVGVVCIVGSIWMWWWPAGHAFHVASIASALARISMENSGALDERRARHRRRGAERQAQIRSARPDGPDAART